MKVIVINAQKKKKVSIKKIKNLTEKILSLLNIDKSLGLYLTNNSTIRKYNQKFLARDRPTDVLSFNSDEEDYLGDIIISVEKVEENAKVFGNTFQKEFLLYITHGILHLLGYSDKGKKKERMRLKEEEILRILR